MVHGDARARARAARPRNLSEGMVMKLSMKKTVAGALRGPESHRLERYVE